MTDTPASDTATLATINDDTRRTTHNQVDIRQAEAEFVQLQRQLTRRDYQDRPQSSTPQPEHPNKDLEKASDDDDEAEERFDLREYLTSSNDANQAAGIKHKHVGVTWEDLQVIGIGGEDNKVNFPSHHASFLCQLLTPPSDLCPHFSCCNFWHRHVPRHARMGFGFPPAPQEVYACPSDTHDHSQVSLTKIGLSPILLMSSSPPGTPVS